MDYLRSLGVSISQTGIIYNMSNLGNFCYYAVFGDILTYMQLVGFQVAVAEYSAADDFLIKAHLNSLNALTKNSITLARN